MKPEKITSLLVIGNQTQISVRNSNKIWNRQVLIHGPSCFTIFSRHVPRNSHKNFLLTLQQPGSAAMKTLA